MKITKDILDLIAILEYRIGNQCYNPNSYNGWTGEEGRSYRYPVVYAQMDDDNEQYVAKRTKGTLDLDSIDELKTVKYKFGSNHLYIGDGIVEILEFLEKRYNLDFTSLERNYQLNTPRKDEEFFFSDCEYIAKKYVILRKWHLSGLENKIWEAEYYKKEYIKLIPFDNTSYKLISETCISHEDFKELMSNDEKYVFLGTKQIEE